MLANHSGIYIRNTTMRGAEKLKDEITKVCNATLSGKIMLLHVRATILGFRNAFDPVWTAEQLLRYDYGDAWSPSMNLNRGKHEINA